MLESKPIKAGKASRGTVFLECTHTRCGATSSTPRTGSAGRNYCCHEIFDCSHDPLIAVSVANNSGMRGLQSQLILSRKTADCSHGPLRLQSATDSQLRHLEFVGLQYVAALQNDGKSGHYHVHAVVNRVDPVTHVAREVWQDRERMRAACREAERLGGWRQLDDRSRGNLSRGARDVEYHTKCRSFERYVREVVGPQVRAAVGVPGASWGEVHRVLEKFGVLYEAVYFPGREGVIQGGRIVGSEPGEYACARDLGPDLTHRKLEERLGAYLRDSRVRKVVVPFLDRCVTAAREVSKLPGGSRANWEAVHAIFERRGLEYQQYRMGARIVDLDSPEAVKASEVDRVLSLGAMSERFGAFASSAAMLERKSAREAVHRAEQLVLGAQLIADPSGLLERLTANHATFTLHTAEKLVCERLLDPEQRQKLLEKIVASSIKCSALKSERVRLEIGAFSGQDYVKLEPPSGQH
jgi:hypothetical protein